jgi:hypothetical protein
MFINICTYNQSTNQLKMSRLLSYLEVAVVAVVAVTLARELVVLADLNRIV